jgi:thioredoxin reductase
MHELIIVGGGPAALAAGAFALNKGLDFSLVLTDPGGWAGWRQTIVGQLGEEYLAGEEAIKPLEQRMLASNQVIHDRVTRITHHGSTFEVTMQQHGTAQSETVIMATGARPNELVVPGAREFMGHGLAYSVLTHAHLMTGKTVAVAGQSMRILRGAAELAAVAQQVFLIVPSNIGVLSSPLGKLLAQRRNVSVLRDAQIKAINGSQHVEEITIAHNGTTQHLAVDAVFVDYGLQANSGPVHELLDLAPAQFISVDERQATRVDGLFAAGDVTTERGEQIMIALGDGARAALSAYEYLLARKLAPA